MQSYVKSKYLEFSKHEGSQHIAGEFAILKLVELVERFQVTSILEIGLGIGTLPDAILNYFKRDIAYVGTEANAFCLKSLKKNLSSEIYQRLSIFETVSKVVSNDTFDLVIVDGKFDAFENVKKQISKNAIIAIEGDRKDQEKVIKKFFPNSKFVHLVSDKKNDPNGVFDSASWQGGVKVFFVNPTIGQNLYWFQEKIKSRKVYRQRRKSKG